MIIRILGEGQYELDEGHLDALNIHDDQLHSAVLAGDEVAFGRGLRALLDEVRELGTPVPDETLVPSDLVIPAEDTRLEQAAALLRDDGLIPG